MQQDVLIITHNSLQTFIIIIPTVI